MHKGFAVCSETVKTDKRLTTFAPEISCTTHVLAVPPHVLAVPLRVLAVETTNSLENFSRIQLISQKHLTNKRVVPDVPSIDSKTGVTPNALYY